MAVKTKRTVKGKRRERKFAPVLIIRLLRSLINPVMRFLGQALVAWALEAPKRARRLPRNLLLRLPRKPQWNMD